MIGAAVGTHFTPAILDNRTRLDAGERERFGFDFQAAEFDDGAVKDILFLQLDDRAVGLDDARGDVLDFVQAQRSLKTLMRM